RRREAAAPDSERFTFHSSRVAMQRVSPEELARMDAASDRCAAELSDARCNALAYACLVAIMAAGPKYHLAAEQRLSQTASANECNAPVITSAGALVDGIRAIGAHRVALVAPYLRPLTGLVIRYLEDSEIEVVDSVSLEVADNLEVGRLDPMALPAMARRLDLSRADALVLSACVQMPSLPAIPVAEQALGLPVLSAASATVYQLLTRLGLRTDVPEAGALLSSGVLSTTRA
ncbi:MAG: aspartate/glutamate racemase family protein, partial [Chloroflexi bacterium]|nr:aspartate/glutamate racemase family protein [Chloroflexota bacterium]